MEMGKFTEQKKFGLVFEEHLLEFIFEVCESDSDYWEIKVWNKKTVLWNLTTQTDIKYYKPLKNDNS